MGTSLGSGLCPFYYQQIQEMAMSYFIQSNSGQLIDPTNQPLSNKGACMAVVTPAMARHWLSRFNIDNRKIRKTQVSNLAYLIENNEYHEDASVISFSHASTLLNGQHTLMAISDTDTPLSLTIQYGMPPEAYAAYDTGVTRSLTDITKIDSSIVAIMNILYYTVHRSGMPKKLSPDMLQKFRVVFNDGFQELNLITNWKHALKPAMIPAAFIASFYVEPDRRDWHRVILRWMANDVDILQAMRMPKVVNAWNALAAHSQILRNGGSTARYQHFLKAMRVFDFQSAEHIKIYQLSPDNFRDKLREIIGV
jgi:hypothetical protein